MNKLISRIQKDIMKLQKVVHKEGNDLLEKIKELDLKTNIDQKKKELFKVLSAKLKKMEPSYNAFIDEVRKNAKKAGVELEKIEKTIKARVGKKTKKGGKAKTGGKKRGRKPSASKTST